MAKPKLKKVIRMTDYIRQYLKEHPEGALSKDIHQYCVEKGATFLVDDPARQRMSIGAQLAYLEEKGEAKFEVVDNRNLWKRVR